MVREKRRSDCPINYDLELFGDRWTLLIIRDLMFKGKQYYGEFLRSEEKIATNILANRLEMMEEAGIIQRRADPNHALKVVYKLTERGVDLVPLLIEVIKWSGKHDKNTAADMKFISKAKKDRDGLIKEITIQLKP